MPEITADVGLGWAERIANHARVWIPLGSDGASSRPFGTQSSFGQRDSEKRPTSGEEGRKQKNESERGWTVSIREHRDWDVLPNVD